MKEGDVVYYVGRGTKVPGGLTGIHRGFTTNEEDFYKSRRFDDYAEGKIHIMLLNGIHRIGNIGKDFFETMETAQRVYEYEIMKALDWFDQRRPELVTELAKLQGKAGD